MERGGGILKEKVADGEWTKIFCILALARTRKFRQNRTFSLTIRTQNVLPDGAEAHIKFLFTQTLSALSYAGGVQVRQTNDFIDFAPLETAKTGVWA